MSRSVVLGSVVVAMTFVVVATMKDARTTAVETLPAPRAMHGRGTSHSQLATTVKEMTARLASHPDDAATVVGLSETLLRLQRVNQDQRSGAAALAHLEAFLLRHPNHYEASRLLAATLASQHRFAEAIALAQQLTARDPRDAVNYGIAGDAYLELGDYERAFEAFDRMGALKPGPAAYARIAYALELKGDLDGALEYMQRAADGTTPNDSESQAWHFSQLGALRLQLGNHAGATRDFERGLATFPNYPLAIEGLARIRVAEGKLEAAKKLFQEQFARAPGTHLAAAIGDLASALGDAADAGRYYDMAEQMERAAWSSGPRQPQVLARLLAERNRELETALALAQEAAERQRDLYSLDALAWANYKTGRFGDAAEAATAALRTGSRDARVLYHAAAIRHALGDADGARALLARLPSRTITDVLIADGLKQLESSLR
jgi:tetratricopeptide (TPR) repeat protein